MLISHFLAKAGLFWLSGIVKAEKIKDWVKIKKNPILYIKKGAEKFGLKMDTTTDWNRILVDENLIHDNILKWAKQITPNVIMALGRTAVKTGKAQEVMAWEKIIEDYTDKSETIHGFTKEALQNIQSGVRDLIKSEKKK